MFRNNNFRSDRKRPGEPSRFFHYLEPDSRSLTRPERDVEPLERRISEIVEPVADEAGYEIVRIRITGARTKTLQVMAERPDGTMSAEDCAALSRAISPVLDAVDPIVDPYTLEVSSPGVDRPLTREKDFIAWEGYEAKIELDRMVEGQKRFRGVLGGVEEDGVLLDVDGEDEALLIPLAWIAAAKLVLTDDLIRESLRVAKRNAGESEEGGVAIDAAANDDGDEGSGAN